VALPRSRAEFSVCQAGSFGLAIDRNRPCLAAP
jgi:hypothetical protein